MPNPVPTWSRATRTPAERQAAWATAEADDSDVEMGETRPPAAGRGVMSSKLSGRVKRQLASSHEQGGDKQQRVGYDALSGNRKRGRDATLDRVGKVGAARHRSTAEPPKGTHPPQAAYAASGTPPSRTRCG